MTQDQQSEPPSWLRPPLFMVGQDSRGNWVVQDKKGMRGGLFVNREAALRYVRSENGFKPQAVVMVSGGFELEMSSNAGVSPRAETHLILLTGGGSPDPQCPLQDDTSQSYQDMLRRCRHRSTPKDVSTRSRSSGYATCRWLTERRRWSCAGRRAKRLH